ncbi:MAG: hypothetical protein HKO57_06745 [Akkermansiaceae bacterium]|nr:hypothetical protein [Akkermansiaceae bacterium]
MKIRRWIRHCQVALTTTAVLLIAGTACGLLWLNKTGFGGEWGERIGSELARRGIHADFTTVKLSPLRGVIARDVTVYFDASREQVFAEIPLLRIDLDRAKALRGELYLRALNMSRSTLRIPLGSDPEKPRMVTFEELTGAVSIDRHGRLTLENAKGSVAGVPFRMEAELHGFDLSDFTRRPDDALSGKRDEFLDSLMAELALWSFPEGSPPRLDLRVRGSLQRPESIRTEFSLEAAELGRRDYSMENLFLSGDLHGRALTLDRLQFSDGSGELLAQASYDIPRQAGRYEVRSKIHVGRLLRTCFDVHILDDLMSARAPDLDGTGEFHLDAAGKVVIGAIGRIKLPRFRFLGTPFEGLETDYSWQDGDLFLQNLVVTHAKGGLNGQLLLQGDTIRYRADSTMPVTVFQPFFRKDGGIDRTVSRGAFDEKSSVRIRAEGTISRSNLKEWAASGDAQFTAFSYRDVPIEKVTAKFTLNPLEAIYDDIRVTFDYSNYPARRRHGGPVRAVVEADRIGWDKPSGLTRITNLRGKAWPGPILSLFAPKTARHVEDTYRLRQPPAFSANGVVDGRRAGERTDVVTRMRSDGILDYTFLGRDLALETPVARIRTRKHRVDVSDFTARTFGGPIGGNVSVRPVPGRPTAYSGGIRWTRLRLRDIGNTYGFSKAEQGYVTGRFDFSGVDDSIRALNGKGAVGLERGDLFYVPVLGPLSPIFGEVLGDKRLTHEQARDASATFIVQNGVMFTQDFLTSTPSTVFTGEGKIDLQKETIDMVIRMNARGLLSLITLPLRPFNGLFQFQGRGPLKNPTWSNAPFTPPPRGKNDPIFRKPPRAQVVPER